MQRVGYTAMVIVGMAVSGCTYLTGYPAVSEGGYYTTSPGYYGGPYSPGYVPPYPYSGPWQGHPGWNEREWHEHRANAYREGGHPPFGRPNAPMPHPGPPVGMAPPRPAAPPPAATPQAAQNRALLGHLGLWPSH